MPTKTKPNPLLQRLKDLRKLMREEGLDYYLVPSADEHLNEYLPDHKKHREWLTGFSGSAGDTLVGLQEAWLFVDSRYYQQAEQELPPKAYHLMKLGLPEVHSLSQVLSTLAQANTTGVSSVCIGFDPLTLSMQQYKAYIQATAGDLLCWKPAESNLISTLSRHQQPEPVYPPVFALPQAIAGLTVSQKLSQLRNALQDCRADALPVTMLDQIAWLYNLRGQDIAYNPVFTAYALVTRSQAFLFTQLERLSKAIQIDLAKANVICRPYQTYFDELARLVASGATVLLDEAQTTVATQQVLQDKQQVQTPWQAAKSPVALLKAKKNPTELWGMRQANRMASLGKVRALAWLTEQLKTQASGQVSEKTTGKALKKNVEGPVSPPLTEVSFLRAIEAFYQETPGFFSLSFNTIAGAGPNSAIVHYATPQSAPVKSQKPLVLGELFLIDSGVQYFCPEDPKPWAGTTDDTRTVILGKAQSKDSIQQKQCFTAVLKAHIACAAQQFVHGTDGIALDALCRGPLWQAGLDFGHGTGHGVGAFLCVHEGPNGIHKRASQVLEPGMITSIEPGYYQPGWGGIRLENLYEVVDTGALSQPDGRPLYAFKPLTLIPFDQNLIDRALLSPDEQAWLNAYHQAVYQVLAPDLNPVERRWLQTACKAL